jgi:hypothetical protein
MSILQLNTFKRKAKIKHLEEEIQALSRTSPGIDSDKLVLKGIIESKNNLIDKLKENEIPEFDILETSETINEARKFSAIKYGTKYYLPVSTNEYVLPTCFVRSALFPAGNPKEFILDKEKKLEINAHNITLILEKGCLASYDRCIFSACLSLYSDNPFDEKIDENWREVTISKIAGIAHLGRGDKVYEAIRNSLGRLSRAKLTYHNSDSDDTIELNPIIEIKDSESKYFSIRISKNIIFLFKRKLWWRFNIDVIKMHGMAGWLGAFYASNKDPFDMSLERIYQLSGLNFKLSDFERKLTETLDKLKNPEVHESARVVDYSFSQQENSTIKKIKVTTDKMKKLSEKLDKSSE